MDELPILALQEIFSFLSLPERLKCKRVSKQWKFAIEIAAGPQSLCIYRSYFPYRVKWCFSEREVISEEILYSCPKKFYSLNSRIELFRDLQKLCFLSVDMSEFINDLHLLSKLKVLMVDDFLIKDDLDHRISLESDSLEKLSFKYLYCQFRTRKAIESIDFNTPSLSSLVFWIDYTMSDSIRNFPVKFRFPLKIRYLECIQFDSDMSVLKNLEILICQKIVCPFKLNDFKSLQRLELFPKEEEELEYVRAIMNEKKSLGRDCLEITVCGFQDLSVAFQPGPQFFSTSFELSEHYLRQVADHSDKLVGHIPWEFVIPNFSIFYKTFREIPNDFFFFKKFVNIKNIRIWDESGRRKKKSPDSSYVLQLLTQSNPERVRISYSFNKQFYEQLISIQSIKELLVDERFENLDYDLFLKLENLRTLEISTGKLPIEFISKIFKLKFINYFSFFCSKFYICIACIPKYRLEITIKKKNQRTTSNEHFDCLDDVIKRIKKLRKDAYLRGCLI